MELTAGRVILRPWNEDDAEECYKYAKDPLVGPAAGWQIHTSVEESRQIIRDILSDPETYAIVLKETGLPIGSIGLHNNSFVNGGDEKELGYWIGVPYWGRGLAAEASEELLRHAFEDIGLSRVWCSHYEENKRSARVQEKLGFKYHHTTDNIFFSALNEYKTVNFRLMTKEDWFAKKHGR